MTLQTTAVTTHSYFGATGVRVVIPAVPGITSALKVSPTLMCTIWATYLTTVVYELSLTLGIF